MASSSPSSTPTLSDMQRAVKDTVHLHWQLFLTQGVIIVILGLLAVIWPQISTIAIDVYVGWLFLLSGVIGLATMFTTTKMNALGRWRISSSLQIKRFHTPSLMSEAFSAWRSTMSPYPSLSSSWSIKS